MNIFVVVKQVPDTETKIQLKADKSGIDESGIKWVMNPYDEFAVEESLLLKKNLPDSKVVVLTLGPKTRVIDTLRTALAMGADEAIVIDHSETLDTFTTAKALSNAIKKEGDIGVIFTGKQSIDGNSAAIPQYIAEFLNIPHATVVSQFSYENGIINAERESDGGTVEKIQLKAPAVIAANKGLNTPRYATLPGIMKAKKKPVKELSLTDLNVNADVQVTYSDFELPATKPAVEMLSGDIQQQVKDLATKLRNEAKVI